MRILIIEDEVSNAALLKQELLKLKEPVSVLDIVGTVEESVAFLRRDEPDLIFMDIKLRDGHSFDVFKQVTVKSPVIFTTAYNEFLQQAFTHNGIEYLLKPIDMDKLQQAIMKYRTLKDHFLNANLKKLMDYIQPKKEQKIVIKRGAEYQTLSLSDIVYFFVEQKIVFCVDQHNKKYITEWANLGDAFEEINNPLVFKANRKHLVNHKFIKSYKSAEFGKLSLELTVNPNEEIIISQDNAAVFKSWVKSQGL